LRFLQVAAGSGLMMGARVDRATRAVREMSKPGAAGFGGVPSSRDGRDVAPAK
jgi:hypothetical protein